MERVPTAVISDVLDEMGLDNQIIPFPFQTNIPYPHVMGSAVTLHVREIQEGEDFKQVYKGLEVFRYVTPGSIVIVATDYPKLAYWGELNTRLAMRAGAIGTVVSGYTRDNESTKELGYPVFSTGMLAKDVKGRCIVDYVNEPVTISGVLICPDDLIVADCDGVIAVPKSVKETVLERSLNVLKNEQNIIQAVNDGTSVEELTKLFGFF